MSNITTPADQNPTSQNQPVSPRTADKGKNKAVEDVSMDEEDDDEEDDDDEEEEEEPEEESLEEIDPSAILPTGRRTRGVRVDYTSKEALAKAGLEGSHDDDDDDEDVKMD